MKTPLLTLLLLAAPAFAFAQSSEPVQDATSQEVARQDSESRADRDAHRDCMRFTGSRIAASRADRKERADVDVDKNVTQLDRDDCVAANGRVYSRDDLRRTGEVDIADALRKLDPAIR
ncbi:MAG: hypothetical protein ACREPV_10265 [Lysobacter sp.]